MIVLGVSGFEDATRDPDVPTFAEASGADDAALTFRHGAVPLQGFPLGVIGHDSAAALLVDGHLVAAAAEERFTRLKHGVNLAGRTTLPRRAIRSCLHQAGIRAAEIDVVAHYCQFDEWTIDARYLRVGAGFPLAEREMIHHEYHSALRRRLAPAVARRQLAEILGRPIAPRDFMAVPHHMAHAAGAYYSAGFDDALIVTLDGYGEAESGLWSFGLDGDIVRGGETQLPTSLGTLYQIVTSYLGFASFGDEYKVMGLSGYGDPSAFAPVFESLLTLGDSGTYSTAPMARADLYEWLRDALGDVEEPGEYTKRSADIAAALQRRLEEAALHQLSYLRRVTRLDRLCLSGGVALNAPMNGAIVRSGLFRQVFVQPAPADDGTALGAALHVHRTLERGAVSVPISPALPVDGTPEREAGVSR